MRIYNVCFPMTEVEIEMLLKKTGEKNKKNAIRKAIEHYLNCDKV